MSTIPNLKYTSVADIDVEELKKWEIKAITFDCDGTLIDENGKLLPGIKEKVKELRKNGIDIGIITNNVKVSKDVLEHLGIPKEKIITLAFKPSKKAFVAMSELMDINLACIAHVGNTKAMDVLGANRADCCSIHVQPLGSYMKKLRKVLKEIEEEGKMDVEEIERRASKKRGKEEEAER